MIRFFFLSFVAAMSTLELSRSTAGSQGEPKVYYDENGHQLPVAELVEATVASVLGDPSITTAGTAVVQGVVSLADEYGCSTVASWFGDGLDSECQADLTCSSLYKSMYDVTARFHYLPPGHPAVPLLTRVSCAEALGATFIYQHGSNQKRMYLRYSDLIENPEYTELLPTIIIPPFF